MWLHVLCCDANGDGTIGVLDWRVSDGPARTLEQFRKLFSPGEIAEELLEAIFGNHDEDEGRHFRSVNLEEIETEEGSVLKLSQMCLERGRKNRIFHQATCALIECGILLCNPASAVYEQ
jgi:hypothetical protein